MYIRRKNIEPMELSGTQWQKPDSDWVLNNLVAPFIVTVAATIFFKELFKRRHR